MCEVIKLKSWKCLSLLIYAVNLLFVCHQKKPFGANSFFFFSSQTSRRTGRSRSKWEPRRRVQANKHLIALTCWTLLNLSFSWLFWPLEGSTTSCECNTDTSPHQQISPQWSVCTSSRHRAAVTFMWSRVCVNLNSNLLFGVGQVAYKPASAELLYWNQLPAQSEPLQ